MNAIEGAIQKLKEFDGTAKVFMPETGIFGLNA